MYENFRLFFSVLWLFAVGATFAALLAVIVSWGDHVEYFVAAAITLAVATAGTVLTSI